MSEDNDGLDEGVFRPAVYDRQEEAKLGPAKEYTLENVREKEIRLAHDVALPFAVVGDEVYCVLDRYQCRPMGRVPDFDSTAYKCPNCQNTYAIPGQAFVDWCKFRGDIRR